MRFYDRIRKQYGSSRPLRDSLAAISPGSGSDENWQTAIQTGMTSIEIREKAKRLHEILKQVEDFSLEASDIFNLMKSGDGKHLEMNAPLLIEGLSKGKMLSVAEILSTLAEYAHIT